MTDDERVESLFLATLARRAGRRRARRVPRRARRVQDGRRAQPALSDMLWALLNSTEFAFNH